MHPQPRDHTAPADDQYEDLLGLWSDLESALSVVLALILAPMPGGM